MTKSIIITFNEADESFLMTLFKRFRIKIQEIKSPNDEDVSEAVPLRVAQDMVTGLQQIDQFERGELSLPSWEDMMSELKTNEKEAVLV